MKILLFVGYKFSWLIKTTKYNNQQDKTKLGSPKKYPQIKVFSQYIITDMTETLKNQNTHEHLWSMETVHMFCI